VFSAGKIALPCIDQRQVFYSNMPLRLQKLSKFGHDMLNNQKVLAVVTIGGSEWHPSHLNQMWGKMFLTFELN